MVPRFPVLYMFNVTSCGSDIKKRKYKIGNNTTKYTNLFVHLSILIAMILRFYTKLEITLLNIQTEISSFVI